MPQTLALVVVLLGGVAVPSAQAEPAQQAAPAAPEVSVRPSDASGEPLVGPGYFVVTAGPGEVVPLHAMVSNSGTSAAVVALQAVDAASSASGGVSYNLPDQPRTGAAAWVDLTVGSVALEPGRGALVPFQLRVPPGTGPGQYVAGLTALVPSGGQDAAGAAGGQAGQQFALRVQTRTVTAIVVEVPGAREARMAVSGVDVERRPDGAYLVVRLRNSGNVMTKAEGTILVTRPGDPSPLVSGPITVDTTVPGTDVTYPILWGREAAPGRYQARIMLAWAGGQTQWDDAFTVVAVATPTARPGAGPVVIATPDPRAAATPATSGPTVARADLRLMLGLAAGLGAVLAGALATIVVMRRGWRRRVMGDEVAPGG